MNGILIDSCILLDIITNDSNWFSWSSTQLEYYADTHQLFINPIIYSEVSIGYKKIEELEDAIPQTFFKRSPIPWEAAFLAGKIFLDYRKAGGPRNLPLPDFFIGAHALIDNMMLMTRDTKRFRYYYPKLRIIAPD